MLGIKRFGKARENVGQLFAVAVCDSRDANRATAQRLCPLPLKRDKRNYYVISYNREQFTAYRLFYFPLKMNNVSHNFHSPDVKSLKNKYFTKTKLPYEEAKRFFLDFIRNRQFAYII